MQAECLWTVRSRLHKNKQLRKKSFMKEILDSMNDRYINIKILEMNMQRLKLIFHIILQSSC